MKIIIILIIVLFIVSGCVPSNPSKLPPALEKYRDIRGECCSLCLSAFSQSPVGVGPRVARCGEFTSAYDIGEECGAYFKTNPMMVQQCQELQNRNI